MITLRTAIRECKRLWKEIVASGLSKWDFLQTEAGWKWKKKNYQHDCPLCQYDSEHEDDCKACPLIIQYGQYCYRLAFGSDPAGFYE